MAALPCRSRPLGAVVADVCVSVKRERERERETSKPTYLQTATCHMAKETYQYTRIAEVRVRVKRGLFICRKRPTYRAKETYAFIVIHYIYV